MIQALMLVGLGFLVATLLALLIAPAAWARAVRLTSHRIRNSLPINETEIRAEKDQLRAGHAVVVHQLEKKIERAELGAARQRVELNRREARIVELEEETRRVVAERDENKNARNVLAQTLNERLPQAEERLREARALLSARDQQIAKFVTAATEQHRALAEASAQIKQQEADLKRLQAAMMARQHATRHRVSENAIEQQMALQSEVSELRERTAHQSRLIERIQEAERTRIDSEAAARDAAAFAAAATQSGGAAVADAPGDEVGGDAGGAAAAGRIPAAAQGFFDRFNRYRAALMRERETTSRLRTELAGAHDRAAKLAAHYREELRTLSRDGGAGTAGPLMQPPEVAYALANGGIDGMGGAGATSTRAASQASGGSRQDVGADIASARADATSAADPAADHATDHADDDGQPLGVLARRLRAQEAERQAPNGSAGADASPANGNGSDARADAIPDAIPGAIPSAVRGETNGAGVTPGLAEAARRAEPPTRSVTLLQRLKGMEER
ncbi:MAG: hypothetical protein AAFQ42_00435 [Pseudomonadota bacterium]